MNNIERISVLSIVNKLIAPIILIVLIISCQPQEEKFTSDSSARLRFSTDTIFFDTLFTSLGSVTKRFRVYNDAENAINISNISLGEGALSEYSIFVNGIGGPEINNVRILGEDSILVLAEVTIDPQDDNLPFLVTDQINFLTNGNDQKVDLVSWGQDANFLRDSVLVCNTTWTADRPYVIYNSILVDEGCTLTVEPGTRIFNHNGSFIFVGGTLDVAGNADERIIFTNDRFDEQFVNAPGQWGGIIFLQGSTSNTIDHADIRNANVGVYLGTPDEDSDPDLIISNTRIENIGGNTVLPTIDSLVQPGYGIIAISSDLYASNVLINNCELNGLANLAGGNYRYEHCTFGNFSFDFFRQEPTVVFSNNLLLGNGEPLIDDLTVSMVNSIVWGSLSEELLFSNVAEAAFDVTLTNNLFRTRIVELESENILNEDPKFFDPSDFDYSLDTLSPAKDVGLDIGVMFDINGEMRDDQPDLGAFERKEN